MTPNQTPFGSEIPLYLEQIFWSDWSPMDEKTPDAAPLTQNFLRSLASFMEREHEPLGEGDISSQVKGAIAEAKTTESSTAPTDSRQADQHHPGIER